MIIRNALMTPDGKVLVSRTVHDYQSHVDTITKKEYMVDGGTDYIRRSMVGDECDLTVTQMSPHYEIRQYFTWGSYGPDGTGPYEVRAIYRLDTDHIEAILQTEIGHLSPEVIQIFKDELKFREEPQCQNQDQS